MGLWINRRSTPVQNSDLAAEAAKATPPITVVGATVAGFPLNDLVLAATLVYVVLQTAFLLYKWRRLAIQSKNDEPD